MIGLIVVASQLLAAIVTGYVGKRDDVGLALGPFEAGFHANFKAFERVDVPGDQVHLLKIPRAPETTQEAAERMDRSLVVLAFAHGNAQQRNQPTRETFLSEGLSGVETMPIREELREVAFP